MIDIADDITNNNNKSIDNENNMIISMINTMLNKDRNREE